MKTVFTAMALIWGGAALAQDVVIIGEIHDNPGHHAFQAEKTSEIQPAAIVLEMLTRDQVALITPQNRQSETALGQALGWADSGWPDFAMYFPILAAAPDARIFGAHVPGPQDRRLMNKGLAQHFGKVGADYALQTPLPEDRQTRREALQMAAHCDALPARALPKMVAFQRLRDAVLADATQQALAETGGPVVVITGNGHARPDWGIPALLAEKHPEITVMTIGQTEDDAPLNGGFDVVRSAPAANRADPCLAFQ